MTVTGTSNWNWNRKIVRFFFVPVTCSSYKFQLSLVCYSVHAMEHLQGLNERQKEAVLHTEGPLLIIAGAGAGKTRVITSRILHLIKEDAAPETILAITFTNKAAKEMKDRVFHLLNSPPTTDNRQQGNQIPVTGGRWPVAGSPWMGTFHSLGAYILRENAHCLDIPKHFAIFDRDDSIRATREAIKEVGLDPKSFEPARILGKISREKGNMVGVEEFLNLPEARYFEKVVGSVWKVYEAVLRREKALDFDDLLLKATVLLVKERAVRERYQKRWRYIHIDEYQDTNHAQYMLAKLLAGEHKNIAVVGDEDQLIYGWRGASIKNILHFEKDYPSAKIVFLEENYRSTQTILTVANRIIKKNKQRKEKTLFTRGAEGDKIGFFAAYDEGEEAAFIAACAQKLIAEGAPPREIVVLFRANFQSRALEEAFLCAKVPHQVLGIRFFERQEVKDILSYVRASLNQDGLADFQRIVNVPPRGIGKVTLLKIIAGTENGLPAATREKIAAFRKLLDEFSRKLATLPLSEAIRWILTGSGLEEELKRCGEDGEERLENIRELVTFAARYDAPEGARSREDAVQTFLEDAALQSEQDELKEEADAVRLMTVHASKGLEFEYVFISGLEEGLFPHERSRVEESVAGAGEARMEEERRLFYVALTRAKKKIFLTYAGVRTIFGSRQATLPSEFILDIDEEFLQVEQYSSSGEKSGDKIIFFD